MITWRSMFAAGTAAACCVAPLTRNAHALDLRLESMTIMEDGFQRQHWYFQADPEHKVMIDFPRGWTTTSDQSSITSAAPDVQNSQIKVEKSPLAPGVAFKDKGLDAYKAVVTKSIPEGATAFQFLESADQPLPVFHWTDFQFVTSYQFFGQGYKRSTTFINLNEREQIVVTAIAPAKSFDEIHKAAMDVARSWSPLIGDLPH